MRLSRVCLTGWGLASGLEIFSDQDYCIHVSPGNGVTPDGHLVNLTEPAYFVGYAPLPEEEKLGLGCPFFAAFKEGKQMPVWELLPQAAKNSIDGKTRRWLTPQTNQERDTPFSTDKVVVLLPGPRFLLVRGEDYLKKVELYGRVRQLEGRRRDFEYADYLFSPPFSPVDEEPAEDNLYRAFNPALLLPSIPLHRFGFRPAEDCTPEELDRTEFPATITSLKHLYEVWKPIIGDALKALNKQIGVLLQEYHPLLFPQMPPEPLRYKLNLLLTNWRVYNKLAERPAIPTEGREEMVYIQYFYDWARDLIQAYHECRDELQVLMAEVCLLTPATLSQRRAFLVLGPAWRPHQDGLAAPFRDEFRQPPIYNGNAERWEKTRLYYLRVYELIESFYLKGALPDESLPPIFRREEDDPFEPDFSRIKITPGKSLGNPLGEQAIPFYYPLTAGAGSLHHYWNYRLTKARRHDQLLSYHASDGYDSYNHPDDWHVTRPLYFSLDDHDFYRIEGHIGMKSVIIDGVKYATNGKPEESIANAIRYLRNKHNLDFEVVEKKIEDGLAENYLRINGEEFTNSFKSDILGAEHLSGVPRGGTFIIVVNEQGVAIADFSLTYRYCRKDGVSPGEGAFEISGLLEEIEVIKKRLDEISAKCEAFYQSLRVVEESIDSVVSDVGKIRVRSDAAIEQLSAQIQSNQLSSKALLEQSLVETERRIAELQANTEGRLVRIQEDIISMMSPLQDELYRVQFAVKELEAIAVDLRERIEALSRN
jgi:hypothetical protein